MLKFDNEFDNATMTPLALEIILKPAFEQVSDSVECDKTNLLICWGVAIRTCQQSTFNHFSSMSKLQACSVRRLGGLLN